MIWARQSVRRMRGGAQSHLMECSDAHFYVVKCQNNPQHSRILVNEMLGTRLARRIGLPAAVPAVVEVGGELIALTPDLCIEMPRCKVPWAAGLQFGSRYPVNPREKPVYDFLPDQQLSQVDNLADFAGMLVFDKWTCNTNGRQTVFFEPSRPANAPGESNEETGEDVARVYTTVMIDQGFCFNAGEWNFPDAPLRGLYARNRVYQGVLGMNSFAPWIERIRRNVTEKTLDEIFSEIPPEWYADDYDALRRLGETLLQRRSRIEELIYSAKKSNRQPFPNWSEN